MSRLTFLLLIVWGIGLALPSFKLDEHRGVIFGLTGYADGSDLSDGTWYFGNGVLCTSGDKRFSFEFGLPVHGAISFSCTPLRGGFGYVVYFFPLLVNVIVCSFCSAVLMTGSWWLERRRRLKTG